MDTIQGKINYLISRLTQPKAQNILSQSCFVFGFVGVAGWGILIALPYIYSANQWWSNVTRMFGCFLVAQVIANWTCARYVDTAYNPAIHGTQETCLQTETTNHEQINEQSQSVMSMTTVAIDNDKKEVMVPVKPQPKRTLYQYFSWTPCLRCNRPRPPRCHHCPLCNTCILKRDHHCYFIGACIGYTNLRHFAVFIFWSNCASIFATIHALVFINYELLSYISYIDLLFPVSICRALFGYIRPSDSVLIILLWILIFFLVQSSQFLRDVIVWISRGRTSAEMRFKTKLTDSRDMTGKLHAVFGHYWLLNFLFPVHFIFEPIDDPVRWPTYKE